MSPRERWRHTRNRLSSGHGLAKPRRHALIGTRVGPVLLHFRRRHPAWTGADDCPMGRTGPHTLWWHANALETEVSYTCCSHTRDRPCGHLHAKTTAFHGASLIHPSCMQWTCLSIAGRTLRASTCMCWGYLCTQILQVSNPHSLPVISISGGS